MRTKIDFMNRAPIFIDCPNKREENSTLPFAVSAGGDWQAESTEVSSYNRMKHYGMKCLEREHLDLS